MTAETLNAPEGTIKHRRAAMDWVQSASIRKQKLGEFEFAIVPVHTWPYDVLITKDRPEARTSEQWLSRAGAIQASGGTEGLRRSDFFAPGKVRHFGVMHHFSEAALRELWPEGYMEPVKCIVVSDFPDSDAAHKRWLEIAHEQLNDLDGEADEEGIEPPTLEARAYAEKFIEAFSTRGLPPPTVFPDDRRGVSIQMGVKQFIFLLTCFEGGHGIYNAIHDEYRMSGSYNNLSIEGIPESPFLKYLQCLMSPLSEYVSLANQTG